MAITYPRDIPACGVRAALLDLADNVAGSPSGGGKINLTQVDDPLWKLQLSTFSLRMRQHGEWSAWKKSMRGGMRSFLIVDTRRRRPLAYPKAVAPAGIAAGWGGTAAVTGLGAGGLLSLGSLPAGYVISAGDRIGLEQGSPLRRGYYEALETVTAGGGAATVTVAPFLDTTRFTTAAMARLWQPKCEMVIDWQSWRDEPSALPNVFGALSFEAWEKP